MLNELNEIVASLTLELRRGTIVLSVLSQLKEPQYGYTLTKSLSSKSIEVDTNTLYPLLRRLEKQKLLVSEWETNGSKPRKYYRRTELGDQVYQQLVEQWREISKGMEKLIDES